MLACPQLGAVWRQPVVALLTGGILCLLPKVHGLLAGPKVFAARWTVRRHRLCVQRRQTPGLRW